MKKENIEIINIMSKPLSDCYLIINYNLLVEEARIEGCDIISQKYKEQFLKGKSTVDVFSGDLFPMFIAIEEFIKKQSPSSIEIVLKNCLTIELKIYPMKENFLVIIKDRTKEIQVEQIIEENNQKISFLQDAIIDIIKSNKPKEILDSLFDTLSSYLDLDFYFNHLLDPAKQKIQLMNYYGISEELAKQFEWLELGEAVSGTVAYTAQKLITEHIQTSDDPKVQLIKGWGVRAYACHPLLSHGKLLGTLSFGSSKRDTFTSDELELIWNICQQVSSSLERAFLITELQEKNEALLYSNQELKVAKEMSDKASKAKTDFLLLMSHELRTPLNSMMGFNQILLLDQDSNLTKKQRTQLEKMLTSSQQLQQMINDILDSVRFGQKTLTFEKTRFDINEMIKDCIRELCTYANNKNVRLKYKEFEQGFLYSSDEKCLRQVIMNLLSNGIKYNKSNGSVRITTASTKQSLQIEVSDTGIGIAESEIDEIFKQFYRSPSINPSLEGSGIGLSISKQIINELGGHLSVTSQINVGSTFVIELPLNQ